MEKLLEPANIVTASFILIMLLLVFRYWGKAHASQILPSVLTSVGVLGTFVGILLGLWEFRVDQISESIPQLLEGLKIAFITSVAGIGLAMAYKFTHQLEVKLDDEDDGQDAIDAMRTSLRDIQKQQMSFQDEQSKTTAALLERNAAMQSSLAELVVGNKALVTVSQQLAESNKAVVEANQQVAEGNKAILKSLAGDEDGSLLTQMQKIRTTLIDRHDETKKIISDIQTVLRENTDTLVSEFREFSKHMMENASAALIQALEGVIRDFNDKLTEQFGENFKQLNQAVGRMVDWLDVYKDQLEQIKQHLAASEQALQTSENSLGTIRGDFTRVVEMSDELKAILEAYGKSKEELQQGMERFNELAEQAKQSLPDVEEKVMSLTEHFAKAVEAAIEQSSLAVEEQAKGVKTLFDEHTAQVHSLSAQFAQAVEQSGQASADSVKEQVNASTALLKEHKKGMGALGEAFAQDLKQITDGVNASVNEQRTHAEALMKEHGQFVSASTEQIKSNSQLVTEASKTLASTTDSMLNEMKQTHEQLSKVVRETSETHGRIISDSVQELTETSKQLATNLARSLESTQEEVGKQIQKLFQDVARNNTSLINQIREQQGATLIDFDKALGESLTKALENLGNKMATVSNKFASDYTPLADSLKRVVEISKGL
jgi:uncharacterized protein YukE